MNTVKIELDLNQLNLVLIALSKLPLENSYDTFNVIKTQADSQLAPGTTDKAKPSAKIVEMPNL